MRRVTFAVSALIVLGFIVAGFSTPAFASSPTPPPVPSATGIGVRLLDVPSATRNDPRARAYIVDNLAPGTTIMRRILIENNTDVDQTVRVYAAAAALTGDAFVGAPRKTANELSRWTTPAFETLDIEAHSSAQDRITIAVPGTATESERYAAIWVEAAVASGSPSSSVISVSRVGIRIYLSVSAGSGPQPSFTLTGMKAHRIDGDRVVVTATATNTGGRAVDVSGRLNLSDGPHKLRAGPFESKTVVTLAPGRHGSISFPLDEGLPRGPWTATITGRSGELTEKLTAKITFPAAGSHVSTLGVIQPPNWWLLIGVIVVLCLIPPAAALSRKRRRARNRDRLSQPKPAIA
ncbi:hypothetical protein BH09ACT1_BH09ACT1_06110 [soil metagenome]